MKRIAVVATVVVAALGLVSCGGGSSSTQSASGETMTTSAPTLAEQASPEVKKALKLVGRRERLNALAREGLLRAAAIHQPEASEAMEAAALEFAEQEEDVQRELDALKGDAENRAYMLFNSEH